MMNAEQLHDALSLLPDDLLIPTDTLRRKKRTSWKTVGALAACACLVIGLWFLFPEFVQTSNKGAERAPGDSPNNSTSNVLADSITQESGGSSFLTAVVTEIHESYILVLPGKHLTDTAQPVTVLLDQLETDPTLIVGQRVKLYCKAFPDSGHPLLPYRIELIND